MTDSYDRRIQSDALCAWFIGPRAENSDLFNELLTDTVNEHQIGRRKYWPTDPAYITKAQKESEVYKDEKKQLKKKLREMNHDLGKSTPIFSPRFQGRMLWDVSMPAVLGYISGMVWNPNNVDVTVSPITTPYEIIAADQICDVIGFDRKNRDYQPWGHITSGGSIANIEAVWSSRNMKFYPLSLQDAVMNEEKLKGAKTFKVRVPGKPEPHLIGGQPFALVELQNCSVWQLLNLDVDDACSMAQGVADAAEVTIDTLSASVHRYAYTSVGIASFLKKHNIKSPRLLVPATCHYSWSKAATVLGLGEDNLIHVKVTALARQDMHDLRQQLEGCLIESIPVISVTAVIGSTEESAVDPLTEILDMREEFKKKGLNFAILADAAWGAYMRTMLIDPNSPEEQEKSLKWKNMKGRETRERDGSEVIAKAIPISPLSQHAIDNLNALRYADTVTSDPHKTGYVPYPAGGLSYRNGTMKEFVRLAAPAIFHDVKDFSVGINGLEGSKPGAAGAGVLLSHRVIGLDKYGYGRILGQSMYGAKMYYCLWLHLSKPTDPFIIKPYLPCSKEDTAEAKKLIIGKSNSEIIENEDAMTLLARVGPDCMINKFGVNIIVDGVMNNDVDTSTEYSKKIGQLLSVNANKDNYRVPLVIFQSMMKPDTYGQSLIDFERSIGLTVNDQNQFGCMVNTVMNPWQASGEFVWKAGEIYREACLLAYGWQVDPKVKHTFVCSPLHHSEKSGWHMYANLVAKFNKKGYQYECVIKLAVVNEADVAKIQALQTRGGLYATSKDEEVFYQMLLNATQKNGVSFEFNYRNRTDGTQLTTNLRVLDTPRVKHLEVQTDPDLSHPDHYQYFMYGEDSNIYISHIITKNSDFQQVVEVETVPITISGERDAWLLWYGFPITFTDLAVDKSNPTKNPLTHENRIYHICFAGEKQKPREMNIILKNNVGWFDNQVLNH